MNTTSTRLRVSRNSSTLQLLGFREAAGWLGYHSTTKILENVTNPNQDPLLCECTYVVFFCSYWPVSSKPTSPSLVSTFGNTCVAISPLILLVVHVLFQPFYLQVCCSVSLTDPCSCAIIKTSKPIYVLPSRLPYGSSFTCSQYLGAIWNVVNFEEAAIRFSETT